MNRLIDLFVTLAHERTDQRGRVIMPRLVFEEPKGGPARTEPTKHRRETTRDNVVVVLKAATFALVIALVGAGILLVTAGGEPEREGAAPAVPEIEGSNAPPTTTTPPVELVVPEVRSQTAVITPTAVPTTTRPTPTPPPATTRPPREDDDRFAVVGGPCDTPGAYAFTERYEPVVCAERPNGKAVWRSVFR